MRYGQLNKQQVMNQIPELAVGKMQTMFQFMIFLRFFNKKANKP